MHGILEILKDNIRLEKQQPLKTYTDMKLKIIADAREKGSGVIKELVDQGVDVEMTTLQVGDYLCSSRVGIEVKRTEDFVNSILDGRLVQQMKNMKYNFERPLVLLEGEEDIYSVRNVHPNAIRGMLAMIVGSYGIPILRTKDYNDTAGILIALAKREQEEKEPFSIHAEKKPLTEDELQEYIVSAFPGVESVIAKSMLKHFKSIKKIANASEEELKEVDKIGEKKAKDLRHIMDREYEG
jgi:ERCC4-type nuclease